MFHRAWRTFYCLSVVAFFLTAIAFAQSPPPVSFAPAANYSVGTGPLWVAVGDFNGDGKLDMATANSGSNTVSVLLGNGDGTFQAPVNYAVGSFPRSIIAGDFNGDGKLDLAVANNGAGSTVVSVLLGNGDGTFQPAASQSGGFQPSAVAAGDFNGDGKLDLAVVNGVPQFGEGGTVSVLLGNGDGTFQAPVGYAVGGTPTTLAVGDFNGDGKPDLAVTNNTSNTVSILLGNGDGTFRTGSTPGVATEPFGIAAGDFNGDGKLDLAVADSNDINNNTGCVSVLLGNGDGTFQPAVNYALGHDPNGVAVADFDGDGKLDLAVAITADDNVSVLLGNGDGTFESAVSFAAGNAAEVAAGDFNGDGRPDLVVPNYSGNAASVLLNVSGPTVNLSATSLAFGSQQLGTTSPSQSVTLTNTGSATLAISSITPSGDFAETNTCGSSVRGGNKCTISVTFTPTALGSRTGAITISDNAANSPQSVTLSGTGIDTIPPVVTVTASPSTLWPPNGKMVPVTVSGTIIDSGDGVNASTAAFAVADEYGQVQPAGGITLGSGGSYSFTVSLQASRNGDDLDGRQYTITVSAQDNAGNLGSASTVVTVLHDQGN